METGYYLKDGWATGVKPIQRINGKLTCSPVVVFFNRIEGNKGYGFQFIGSRQTDEREKMWLLDYHDWAQIDHLIEKELH